MPVVEIATARDIVEHCGISRLVFTDFPLGNPCGVPEDVEMQRKIVGMALDLLEQATEPRTTVQSPFVWPHGERWKELIFTEEQPFLDEEAEARWLTAKERYRDLKDDGKL